ncbi:carbohydrate ABC transporter permease [Streptomyces bathyalis]|uniref:Carbohydrate ABC transporter permease n=1 Tax=Streptomyces bathyalis TaxID=2710756 RepID=A0A7T1T2S8_9ACTN|nr:carbohydrate ABC transporter permease [Streptomyces bathyalis]QPP05313.1 carbohydrate ABC transporter permease [Streptomyces bathyalis]
MTDRTQAARLARRHALSLLLVLTGLLMLAPVHWLFVTALQPAGNAFSVPPDWLPDKVTFHNFSAVFDLIPYGEMILSSLKITVTVTAGSLITSALAAYAFARLRFPGRDVIFFVLLAALMLPQQLTVIPTFILMRNLGLVDTHASVILPALVNVLGIFLLRQFFLSIPPELDEAARIDGAGHLRILFQVILPLSGPALSALAIFIFQLYWNDFFWPNIFLNSPGKMTLPVGLVALQGSQGGAPALVVFAAIAMIVAPVLVLFLFFQRALIESVASSGLKG